MTRIHSPKRHRAFHALCFCSFVCGGCASTQPKALDAIYSKYEANRVAQYTNYGASSTGVNQASDASAVITDPLSIAETDKTTRNRVMNDLILLIDNNYYKSEKSLVAHKAWTDFAGSLAVTGLSTAGAVVAGTDAKTLLAALVTAINSTKTSINTDLLQNQTLIAVIAKMHDLRATKLLDIRTSMKTLDTNDYPLSYGLVDLLEYYNDGTFSGALQSMTESSAAAAQNAKTALGNLKNSYSSDSSTTALRNFWKPGGKVNAANAKAFNAWLATNENGVDIATFLYGSTYASERSKAAAALIK